MAKIIIDVDTEQETLKVTIDGQDVPDVQNVYAYLYTEYGEDEKKARVEISSGTQDKESKIYRTITTTCAGNKVETSDSLTQDIIQALKIGV